MYAWCNILCRLWPQLVQYLVVCLLDLSLDILVEKDHCYLS